MKHDGKAKSVFREIMQHWVAQGSPAVLLGPLDHKAQTQIIDDIMGSSAVTGLRQQCILRATASGEWKVLQHDATFKVLFTVIGQGKMAQKEGEVHAAHTLLGQ